MFSSLRLPWFHLGAKRLPSNDIHLIVCRPDMFFPTALRTFASAPFSERNPTIESDGTLKVATI